MQSSAERGHRAFMARTEAWITAYLFVALAVLILFTVTRNPATIAILPAAILLLERIRRAREWDLRSRDGAESTPRKVRIAAKSKRE